MLAGVVSLWPRRLSWDDISFIETHILLAATTNEIKSEGEVFAILAFGYQTYCIIILGSFFEFGKSGELFYKQAEESRRGGFFFLDSLKKGSRGLRRLNLYEVLPPLSYVGKKTTGRLQ